MRKAGATTEAKHTVSVVLSPPHSIIITFLFTRLSTKQDVTEYEFESSDIHVLTNVMATFLFL